MMTSSDKLVVTSDVSQIPPQKRGAVCFVEAVSLQTVMRWLNLFQFGAERVGHTTTRGRQSCSDPDEQPQLLQEQQ